MLPELGLVNPTFLEWGLGLIPSKKSRRLPQLSPAALSWCTENLNNDHIPLSRCPPGAISSPMKKAKKQTDAGMDAPLGDSR